jgi:hypothetical protein
MNLAKAIDLVHDENSLFHTRPSPRRMLASGAMPVGENLVFTLVAASKNPILDGVVATRTFGTVEEAEKVMRQWARFGVNNQCNEADLIYICDANSKLVSTWSRGKKAPVRAE